MFPSKCEMQVDHYNSYWALVFNLTRHGKPPTNQTKIRTLIQSPMEMTIIYSYQVLFQNRTNVYKHMYTLYVGK